MNYIKLLQIWIILCSISGVIMITLGAISLRENLCPRNFNLCNHLCINNIIEVPCIYPSSISTISCDNHCYYSNETVPAFDSHSIIAHKDALFIIIVGMFSPLLGFMTGVCILLIKTAIYGDLQIVD
jgi:hypothetical protein